MSCVGVTWLLPPSEACAVVWGQPAQVARWSLVPLGARGCRQRRESCFPRLQRRAEGGSDSSRPQPRSAFLFKAVWPHPSRLLGTVPGVSLTCAAPRHCPADGMVRAVPGTPATAEPWATELQRPGNVPGPTQLTAGAAPHAQGAFPPPSKGSSPVCGSVPWLPAEESRPQPGPCSGASPGAAVLREKGTRQPSPLCHRPRFYHKLQRCPTERDNRGNRTDPFGAAVL